MSGNVWEWVNDWFGNYIDSPATNPQGPAEGDFRIVKGGSWFGYIGGSRVACRGSDDPGNRRSYIGFRVALSVEQK
jgi:formylglycine-generating enzyme required for sulfatase activity